MTSFLMTAQQVYDATVPAGSLTVWALGQSGFLFKDHTGLLVAIDPCLTDPVVRVDTRWARLYPPPLRPEDLAADLVVLTHDHLDHLDPGTIARLDKEAVKAFVGPGSVCRHLASLGIQPDRILRLDAAQSISVARLKLTGVLALTNDPTIPDAEGIVIQFPGGPALYHTGDTGFSALLAHAAHSRPTIYLPCINGKYGNMNAWEAAVLGAALHPAWAIPHHYDMFQDNLAEPGAFVEAMRLLAPCTRCTVLGPGRFSILEGQ
ncbi:MAG: MBL fold metallo-hydrolase [Acidobacteriota bacterium]